MWRDGQHEVLSETSASDERLCNLCEGWAQVSGHVLHIICLEKCFLRTAELLQLFTRGTKTGIDKINEFCISFQDFVFKRKHTSAYTHVHVYICKLT